MPSPPPRQSYWLGCLIHSLRLMLVNTTLPIKAVSVEINAVLASRSFSSKAGFSLYVFSLRGSYHLPKNTCYELGCPWKFGCDLSSGSKVNSLCSHVDSQTQILKPLCNPKGKYFSSICYDCKEDRKLQTEWNIILFTYWRKSGEILNAMAWRVLVAGVAGLETLTSWSFITPNHALCVAEMGYLADMCEM